MPKQNGIKNFSWLLLSIVMVALDQCTKYWALHTLIYNEPMKILPFFNFTLSFNAGAAFSFLSDANGWQQWLFGGIAVVMSIVILVWMYRLPKKQCANLIALSFILGGAIGNLWDRIEHGFVIDFIQVHYQHWYFPTFNVADSAITIGAVILVFGILKKT